MNRTSLAQIVRVLAAVMGVAIVPLALLIWATAPLQAQDDPDFGAIDDPLNGSYQLANVSDLLVMRTKPLTNSTYSEVNNYLLETANQTIVTQTKQTVATVPCYLSSGRQPQRTRIGHFFQLDYEVILTLRPTFDAVGGDCVGLPGDNNMVLDTENLSGTMQIRTPFSMSAISTALTIDDFTGDGLDDIFLMSNAEVLAATAVSITQPTEGYQLGAPTAIDATLAAKSDPTTGDFNGDGLTDVAWIGQDFIVHFATVCPGAVAGTVCAGKAALDIVLNPLKAGETKISVPNFNYQNCYATITTDVALTAGNYADDGSDGLVTTPVELGTKGCQYLAEWYEFEEDFSLTGGTYIDSVVLYTIVLNQVGSILAESAPLDWYSGRDQAVIAWGGETVHGTYYQQVAVLSFSDQGMTNTALGKTVEATCPLSPVPGCVWVHGLATGHFSGIAEDAASAADLELEIAILTNDGSVSIYDVEVPTVTSTGGYTPTLIGTSKIDASLGLNTSREERYSFTWLVAGDLQGRGLWLGAPSIVRIPKHSQPSVILGAPPMHVDYVKPQDSDSAEVYNFTAAPSSFNSKYTVSDSDTTQSSKTNTSSFSYADEEALEEKFRLKVPLIAQLEGSFKQSWKETGETTSSKYKFTENEYTFNAATTTGFNDEIWYSIQDFNIYYYPVLGKTVTVTDTDGGATQAPLYVTFSGPSNSSNMTPVEGALVEWYQPVHQPGQIFSYPWNLAQLEDRYSGADMLTSKSIEGFLTDDSETTESVTWSQNSGTAQTTGSSSSFSFETDNSLTGGYVPFDTGPGASVSGSYDYNSSTSTGSLNQSSTTLGASTGIDIAKPSFEDFTSYAYVVRPFIFGQASAIETAQELELGTDIQTSGPLITAYTADPTDAAAGSWWASDDSAYTQYIDVALNHPTRWNMTPSGTGDACIVDDEDDVADCAIPYSPQPDDVWNSQFYHMRGLLVTVGVDSGPQRAQATVGDEVYLQARVYNYSLKDMPDDSKVHVRFYRQEISGTTPVTGTAVLIEEVTAGPLPAFNSTIYPDDANWTTVGTSFTATSELVNKHYIFWIVAWAEDGSGLLAEVPSHGLTEVPGALKNIGDAPMEMVTITNASGEGVDTSFTNNVGMYKQKFYIQEAPSSATLFSSGASTLSLASGKIARASKFGFGTHLARAEIVTGDDDIAGVEILYYSGDPADEGTVLHDVDFVPYLRGNRLHPISIPFQPETCGASEMVIVVRSGASILASSTIEYDVTCSSVYFPIVSQMDPALD